MRKVGVVALVSVVCVGLASYAQEEATVDPLRQRCHQFVSSMLGFEVDDVTLDNEYLDPYWNAVNAESRQQSKSKEQLFLARMRHVVEEDVRQAVLAWRQKRLQPKKKPER